MLNDAAVSQFKKVYLAPGYTYTNHSRDRQVDQYYANLKSQQHIMKCGAHFSFPVLIYKSLVFPSP